MFQKISRYIAPCILAAASLLASGCPQKSQQPQIQAPSTMATQQLSPATADPNLPIDQNYRTVSTNRSVRSGSAVFPVELKVEGPERVRRRQKAVYTATVEKLPSEYIAIGAATSQGDITFFPEGDGFKRLPPNGEFVRVGDSRYPYDDFEHVRRQEEVVQRGTQQLAIISRLGRETVTRQVIPNLPSWYSDPTFTQSDLYLFTQHGSVGFSGARQQITCSANKDTTLKVFALFGKSMDDEAVLLTTDFFIDVEDVESKPLGEPKLTPISLGDFKQYDRLTISPDGRKLLVYASKGMEFGLFVTDIDGSNSVKINNRALSGMLFISVEYDISWSPDSRKILYETERINGEPETEDGLWVADAETGQSRKLTSIRGYKHAWSPGSKILVASGSQQKDIHSVDPETGEVRKLTSTLGNEDDPSWSPRGAHIVFTADKDVWLMNADGSNKTNLTNTPDKGEKIWGWMGDDVLVGDTGGGSQDLSAIDIHGRRKPVYRTDDYWKGPGNPTDYRFESDFISSVDGRRLLFIAGGRISEAALGGYNCYNLFLLDTETGEIKMLTREKHVREVSASPDLSEIIYFSERYLDQTRGFDRQLKRLSFKN